MDPFEKYLEAWVKAFDKVVGVGKKEECPLCKKRVKHVHKGGEESANGGEGLQVL